MELLRTLTRVIIGWYSPHVPEGWLPLVVGLTYLFLTALLASFVFSWSWNHIWGIEGRLASRIEKRLISERPRDEWMGSQALRSVAHARLFSGVAELSAHLGGRIVRWPFPRFIRPLQVARPLAVLTAGVVTTLSWPNADLRDFWVDAFAMSTSDQAWNVARAYLPVALVLIAVGLALPRSPIVDRVRARDEAAKDANRLLAELSSATGSLYYSSSQWASELVRSTPAIVDERVRSVSGQRCSYAGRRLSPSRPPYLRSNTADSGSLVEDIAQVQEVLKKIDKAGLAFVATRLASSTEPFIWIAEINWHKHKGKERLFGEYFDPDELEKVVGKRLRQGDYRDATDPLDLERLERDASGLEKFL